MHVYEVRGPIRAGGWFSCVCGKQTDRTEYLKHLSAAESHRLANCPCCGDLSRCVQRTAEHAAQRADQRVAYAERRLQAVRWEYEDALNRLRDAEQHLQDEQARAAERWSSVEGVARAG